MTQYPSPYQGPQVQYPTPAGYPYQGGDPGAHARRAGVMLFVLGGIGVISGLCCGVFGAGLLDVFLQRPEFMQQLPPETTPGMLRGAILVAAGLGFLYGVAQVALGVFVRKNMKWAIVTAIVLAGLSLVYLALTIVKAILMGAQEGAAEGAGGLCVALVPAVLYAVLMVWLVQAFRSHAAARAAGEYARQYWQYAQQQQQAYQQQGWGHVPPPPPPPVVPPVPPAPMPPPPTFGEEGPRGGADGQ